ncbi:hypothetical protein [Janthinobacterium sp. 17J80-10]|uniref:hypothetical protein n=1 Tax=Janthinobacterium sp. 17J80-10 TaxID=2497863 RepID=UPI001F5107B1|nr:hypothetical protein [Janthinobacterium sp. 17J80-10]
MNFVLAHLLNTDQAFPENELPHRFFWANTDHLEVEPGLSLAFAVLFDGLGRVYEFKDD